MSSLKSRFGIGDKVALTLDSHFGEIHVFWVEAVRFTAGKVHYDLINTAGLALENVDSAFVDGAPTIDESEQIPAP